MYALAPLLGLLIAGLLATVLADVHVGPQGNLPRDFTVYVSAATVVRDGGNPYNSNAIWVVEHQLLGLSANPPTVNMGRVAEPPLVFWAMQLLTDVPFPTAAIIGAALALLCVAGGLFASARGSGVSRPLVPVLLGVAMPPAYMYVNYRNFGVVVFLALALGLWLARRYPLLAGVVLSIAICKPQVALPLAGLVILFHNASRWRTIGGFILGTMLLLGSSVLVTGPQSLMWWLQSFGSFGGTLVYQPQIASLPGLYMHRVSAHVSLLLMLASLLVSAGATAAVFWRYRHAGPVSVRQLAWLWLLWFMAAPYDHFYDYLFLAPVALSCFAEAGGSERMRAVLVLYVVLLLALFQDSMGQMPALYIVPLAVLTSLLPFRPFRLGRGHTASGRIGILNHDALEVDVL